MLLQTGLASQLHHLFMSEFLVDTLSVMGFGSSYREVQRIGKIATSVVASDVLGDGLLGMVLFAADNVDRNILTSDGKGICHSMGMIVASTPGKQNNRVVPRNNASALKLKEMAQVLIVDYRFSTYAHRSVKFEALTMFQCLSAVDLLWELLFSFHQETPNWQGIMHIVYSKCEYPGQSTVHFLPVIDMYPGDPTCILSTLTYICSLAEAQNFTSHYI